MFQIEIIITGIESRIRSRQTNSAELNSSRSPALSNRYLTLLSVHVWRINVGIRCPVVDLDYRLHPNTSHIHPYMWG